MAIASNAAPPLRVVLTGNPNCGKTTLFNALTGLRARVGNYAGVTVERREGTLVGIASQRSVNVLDLPGTYSLSPQSPDEEIASNVLFVRLPEVPEPDLVLVVIDASNLQRNLYYATQVIELGHRTWVILNMVDVARENGIELNVPALSAALGVPVFPLVASTGEGLPALRNALALNTTRAEPAPEPRSFTELTETFRREVNILKALLETVLLERKRQAMAESVLLLSDDRVLNTHAGHYPEAVTTAVTAARNRLEAAGVDWRSSAIEARYARAAAIEMEVTTATAPPGEMLSDRLDRVLTHRVWGLLIFVLIMAVMFQSLFTFAELPKSWIEAGVNGLSRWVESILPPGDFRSLLSSGIIQGVGSVITFLPQICFLFLFLSALEDTGYMARAAFLMDRLMSRVGLHGKSFIPLLSSFGCAIPGLMATRTIDSPKDR
ncbi:MAG: ferrous iron transport protein B, partial [Pedosphaera sp.]|nr:ferrous iron transport protein B [Pedosphaera sp.]